MNVLIVNIGNNDVKLHRDVTIPGIQVEPVRNTILNTRTAGELLLNQYENFARSLYFPILKKVLSHLSTETNLVIDRLFLYATDQSKQHADISYLGKDTIFFAEIIRKWLVEAHPTLIRNIEIRRVTTNPSNFDEMFQLYDAELRHISAATDYRSNVYLSLSGGTQAMNGMLMIHAIKAYQDKVTCLHITEQSDEPHLLSVGRSLFKEEVRAEIQLLVSRHDYDGAQTVLKRYQEIMSPNAFEVLYSLLAYAHRRFCFDFQNAIKELENVCSELLTKREISQLIDVIRSTSDDRYMEELIGNASVLYQQGNYVDFLGRVYRFQEQIMRDWMQRRLGISLIKERFGYLINEDSLKSKYPDLLDHLRRKGVLNKPIDRKIGRSIVEFFTRKNPNDHKLRIFSNKIQKLFSLVQLRNDTFMAHGFKGVSVEKLNACYNGNSQKSNEDMRFLFKYVYFQDPKSYVYSEIDTKITSLLSYL